MRNESSYDLANHINKMAVSTALAGVRQRNIFGIYMENYDTYKQAISEAEKAQGTAARKMQAYNESVAYSINQLSAAWEGFTQKLEASPAVKGVYWILTQGIKNIDHILQWLMPVIATFNADKIVSLAKFLSPLITVPLKGIRYPIDTVVKSKGAFYENMTQKMTAENTNAIEELTNATRDNTAALRGEKSKGGQGGTNKGDASDKSKVKEVRPGSIQDLQNQIDTDEQSIKDLITSGKDENAPEVQALRAKQAEKQKQILKKRQRSTRLKTGAVTGLAAGFTRFANKGSSAFDNAGIFKGTGDVEVDTGEALAMGVAQGALTGVATAFMGPAGAVFASIVGDALSSLWKKFAHADEIDRKQRVEDAKKQLEAIKGIESSVTSLIDLNKKDQALWDSEDWKQFNEQVETINDALEKSELGDKIINLGDKTQTLSEYFEEAARTGNKDRLARVEAEKIRFEAEKTYAAGEQDRYTLLKEINENQKKLAKLDDDETSKKKELTAAIKAAKAEIEDYSEALKKGYMQASFYSSGVGTMESYDIGNATLDRVIMQIAREWAKDSPDIFAGNQLTSDARSDIISYLREQSGYASLFKNDTKNVGDMLTARDAVDDLRKSLNMSQKQLKEFANSKDLSEIADKFGATGDALYKIIDQVNLVDEDGITTIAHAMNMTVEEFERANADGAFNWLTTDVAIGGLDKLNEKMQTFNDLLSAASEGSLLTSENLNKIANQFPTLLRGVDEAGKYTTDLSSDNILDNIVRMMTNEDSLREIYSGLFSGSVAKNSEIWNNFMTLGKGSEIANSNLSDEIKERVKKVSSYSEVVDIFSRPEMEEYNEAFKEYVSSMYPITDLLDTQAKILKEYGEHTLETEISNLESVRDSLDNINRQREKELELIKAKEALENASKEKKRVYRAGVGFVYTTDQEAMKSAQEKVNELEKQRDKDNIQYQIDSLQQQKEILENIENNKQLESLIDVAESILGNKDQNGGISGVITAIQNITSDEFAEKIKEQVKAGITESTKNTNEEEKENALKEYKEKKSGLDVFDSLPSGYRNERGKKITNAAILNNPNSPYYEEVLNKYNTRVRELNELAKKYNQYEIDDKNKIGMLQEKEKLESSRNFAINSEGLKGVLGAGSNKYFGAQIEEQPNPDWKSNSQYVQGSSKNIYIAKQLSDGTFGKFEQSTEDNINASDAIEKIKGPAVIVNNSGSDDHVLYKDKDGNIHNVIVRDEDGNISSELTKSRLYSYEGWNIKGDTPNFWNNLYNTNITKKPYMRNIIKKMKSNGAIDYKDTDEDEIVSILDKQSTLNSAWDVILLNGKKAYITPSYIPKDNNGNIDKQKTYDRLTEEFGKAYDSYIKNYIAGIESNAFGTLSFSGGHSLINENGLESIITPQGTITSLPAKTGIVPADLTRNLWALGEVAPNLIARLGGSNLQSSNSSTVTDNSINIQNLDATFNTHRDFNGDEFIRDLRNQIELTKNE